jgi:hypothetical protein
MEGGVPLPGCRPFRTIADPSIIYPGACSAPQFRRFGLGRAGLARFAALDTPRPDCTAV